MYANYINNMKDGKKTQVGMWISDTAAMLVLSIGGVDTFVGNLKIHELLLLALALSRCDLNQESCLQCSLEVPCRIHADLHDCRHSPQVPFAVGSVAQFDSGTQSSSMPKLHSSPPTVAIFAEDYDNYKRK